MAPPHLHLIAIDPGATTGWVRLTVPRDTIYGREPGEFLEWDQGQLHGEEEAQVLQICRMVRETEGLDYPVGPALVVEDFDIMPKNPTTDQELLSPVRIGAMLRYAKFRKELSLAHLVFQSRTLAKQHMTDERLKQIGMYIPGEEHARDAMRHGLTALRRAKGIPEFRDELWNHA